MGMAHRQILKALAPPLMACICGCSDVPASYKFDSGVYPQHQDDEVRFRTTYYLRVFDLCAVDKDASSYEQRMVILTARKTGPLQLVKDSLLRFRMTGQASALFSNLRFESGVVNADEVEPFGKTVDYDDSTKKFAIINQSLGSYSDVKAGAQEQGDKCPGGEPVQRRFYLLGPEGVRQLDPNERLIMAMYTDAKPLITSLKHFAGQRANKDAEQLLPFDIELSKATAESALSALKDNGAFSQEPAGLPPPQILGDRVLPLFGKEGHP